MSNAIQYTIQQLEDHYWGTCKFCKDSIVMGKTRTGRWLALEPTNRVAASGLPTYQTHDCGDDDE